MSKLMVSFFDQFPEWNGIQFEFRGEDGYVNVTTLNTALNRKFSDWSRTAFAKELLDELSVGYGIPIDCANMRSQSQKPLIDYVRGGNRPMFIHPAVALSYCMSNPRLQARINMWVLNMLSTGTSTPHYKDWSTLEYLQGVEYNRDDIEDLYGE